MVNEIEYVSIKRVLDNLLDHPLLKDVTLEQAVRYTIRFIALHGYPKFYKDKIEDVEIEDFRGPLPCDLVSITQVKDLATGVCLRHMTDTFNPGLVPDSPHKSPYPLHEQYIDGKPPHKKGDKPKDWYIPPTRVYRHEPTFKTQGRCIFTSFPEGVVGISYKAMPVDEEGFPLLIDNEVYLAALEAYIKKQVFTTLFDTGKISAGILQEAKQNYAFLAGQVKSEFTMPSLSEAESISRMLNTMIPNVTSFDRGFRDEGNREYLRRH